MFPKCRHSFLCRAQILLTAGHFAVDLKGGVWYDSCVGSDFSGSIFLSPGRSQAAAENEMTPDIRRGSFQFLGFNHWVTSLSAGSTGLIHLVGIPSAAFMFFSLRCDWHLCKTEDVESPVGRCHYHIWYHLFSYHQSTMFQDILQDGISHK